MASLRKLWRRFRRPLGWALLFWLTFCIVLAIAIMAFAQTDYRRPVDVIIALGGGMKRDGTASPATARRALEAAVLYHEGYAPTIICSGGVPFVVDRAEAEGCADVLRANGVPDEAIVLESRSHSTEQNALYSKEIMQERGWTTALVVSDGYHLMRARWIFAEEHIEAYTVPTEMLPGFFDHVNALAREILAYHWQIFKTVFALPFTNVPFI